MRAITAVRPLTRTIAGGCGGCGLGGVGLGNGLTKTPSTGKPGTGTGATGTTVGVVGGSTTVSGSGGSGGSGGSTASSSRRDPAVATLQQQLSSAGYNPGTIDGVWGPRTQDALQRAVSSMGINAAIARFGQAAVNRLGTPVAETGGGVPTEEQGGLFDGVTRWFSGIFGGGTDQAAAAAAGAATSLVETAGQAAGTAAGREAATAAQQRITEVVSNPLFLIGGAVLAVGVAMALLPTKASKRKAAAKRRSRAA